MVQLYVQKENNAKESKTYCFHKNTIFDDFRGEIICNYCGQVLKEKIDSKENYFVFESDTNLLGKSHHGDPITLSFENPLSTVIDKKRSDYSGKPLSQKNNLDFYRLRNWDSRLKNRKGRLSEALAILDGLVAKLNLPYNIQEQAAYLYRKSANKGIVKGRGVLSVIGACLYMTCKSSNIPRSMNEISNIMNIPKKSLYKAISKIQFQIEIPNQNRKPSEYLPILSSKLSCSEKVKRRGFDLLKKIEENSSFMGRNPYVLGATALWFSLMESGTWITKTEFCEKCGISTVSLRYNIEFFKKRDRLGDFSEGNF